MTLEIGQEIGEYVIESLLGEGGMGAVYRAHSATDGRLVAIKELRLDGGTPDDHTRVRPTEEPEAANGPVATAAGTVAPLKSTSPKYEKAKRQFQHEADLLTKLDHPNLPKVTGYFDLPSGCCYVMTFIRGRDLQSVLDDRQQEGQGPLSVEQVLIWMRQVLSALEHCHARGVVHRDIKPANIIVDDHGKASLVDFGLSRQHVETQRESTALRGRTRGFAPLEQYTAKQAVDERSDVYAAGATLYSLLTGHMPEEAVERAGGAALISPRQLNPAIPVWLEKVVVRALALNPEKRYRNAQALKAALDAKGDRSPVVRWLAAGLALVFVCLLASALIVPRLVGLLPRGTATSSETGTPLAGVRPSVTASSQPEAVVAGAIAAPEATRQAPAPASELPPTQTATPTFTLTATWTPSPTPSPSPTPMPAWQIAYTSDESGKDAIWMMEWSAGAQTGNHFQRLTEPSWERSDWHVEWCDSNQTLLFERGDHLKKGSQVQELYQLTLGSPPGSEGAWWGSARVLDEQGIPKCARSGGSVIFVAYSVANNTWQLYLVSDGQGPEKLAEGYSAVALTLSHDGNWVALAWRSAKQWGLSKFKLADASLQDVTPTDWNFIYGAAWSPDGTQLGLIGRGLNVSSGLALLRLADANGTLVSQFPAQQIVYADKLRGDEFSSVGGPTWSPDGRWLAYASNVDGDWDIYAMDVTNSQIYNLTNDRSKPDGSPSNEMMPAWSK